MCIDMAENDIMCSMTGYNGQNAYQACQLSCGVCNQTDDPHWFRRDVTDSAMCDTFGLRSDIGHFTFCSKDSWVCEVLETREVAAAALSRNTLCHCISPGETHLMIKAR